MPLVKWAAGMDLKELLYCYFKSENNNIFKKKLRFWAKFDGILTYCKKSSLIEKKKICKEKKKFKLLVKMKYQTHFYLKNIYNSLYITFHFYI